MTEVIEDNRHYYCFDRLATLRSRLLQNHTTIEILDLGAGSRKKKGNKRLVSEIAKHSVSPKWQCHFLFRLSNFLKSETILEMGSSLGLSSMYLHFGNLAAEMISLEGSPEIAKLAKENYLLLDADIKLMEGHFKDSLPIALQKLKTIGLAFIDGHHLKEPTIDYFEQILPYCTEDSVLVFDDIYWSDEMAEAWELIKKHPKVKLSIDLFWCGIIFFKNDFKEKQDFTLIPFAYKPWQIGLFK
jgi:predicted O-methyltransferase YrrM